LPSIEQVMPWLHLIFEAWEDYRRKRAEEDEERARQELAATEIAGEGEDETGDDRGRKKKRKDKRKK
jgi:hypothetical protein